MDEDLKNRINKIYLPHLRGKFEEGQVILFTGCGFSRDTNNICGSSMPLANELKELYWNICYPGETFDGSSSLQDLYDTAVERHKHETAQRTIQLLTVDRNSIPAYYELIFSFPWLRCYTLNIDDTADATFRHFELPRNITSISATAVYGNYAHSGHDPASLLMIHLNGMLSDIPDHITFSTTQYAERIAHDDAWYRQLSADFLGRPIIFVGTTLDEPPLWSHIEIRRERGGRDTGELRPRSYLLTPTLSRARQDLLSKHNVVWLPFNTKEFVDHVLIPLKASIPTGLKTIGTQLKRDISKSGLPLVSEIAVDVDSKTEYLLGQEPEWSDIHSGRAVERDFDESLWGAIQKSLTKSGPKYPILITGTAGSGKSTALMRASLRLSASGIRVGWVDRSIECSARDFIKGMKSDHAPQVIAIDDADVYGVHLTSIIRECTLHEKAPLLLVEVRSNRIDRVINRAQLQELKLEEITADLLTDSDIDKLLKTLDKENRLGKLKGMTLGQQREAFRSKAGRELIVAMYEATTGLDFRTKMIEELYGLEGVSRFIYAIVAVASTFRFDLTRDEVIIATGDASNATLNEIELLIKRHMVVCSPSDKSLLRCRHRVIASVLIEALIERGEMYNIIRGLIVAATTKLYENGHKADRPNRIIRHLLNHDFVFRTLDLHQGRRLYGSLEDILKGDYHFWLHRGSMEVEWGDLGHAENFLSQALSYNDRDPLVRNEWAYLLFKKANMHSSAINAPKLVEEATSILMSMIDDPDIASPHPFHVLCSQGLSWSRRGIRDELRRKEYLSWLDRIISKGAGIYPREDQLQQLKRDIKQELLSMAVRH